MFNNNSKRLLFIDTCLVVGSTGRITENIAQLVQCNGWECFIIHGARYVKRPSCMIDFQSVSILGEYIHYAESLLFDNHGLSSRRATKMLIDKIKEIKPDIIHLHCLHGYFFNYRILFEYLRATNIPIVWTFHDCWAFTGHCSYFDNIACDKWKVGCHDCALSKSYPKSLLIDRSKRNYNLKKSLFTSVKDNLFVVTVSHWLENLVRQSFFKQSHILTIHNGIDINSFHPKETEALRKKLNIGDKKVILGVAMPWSVRKGLPDMIRLSIMLPQEKYQMILVGLNKNQLKKLPPNIIGIRRLDSIEQLSEFYSLANVFINPTYEDNFPTTNLESLACGTPVITYSTGGSPEAIDRKTGFVVEKGDLEGLCSAVYRLENNLEAVRKTCRERAVMLYDSALAFSNYLRLYESIFDTRSKT